MYLDFCAASNSRLVKLFLPNGLNQPEGEQSHTLQMNAKIRDKRYKVFSCRPRQRRGREPSFLRAWGSGSGFVPLKSLVLIPSTTLCGVGHPSPNSSALGISSLRTNMMRGCRGSPPTLRHPCHLRTLSRRAGWEGKPIQPGGIRKTGLGGFRVAKSNPAAVKLSLERYAHVHTPGTCERRSVFAEVRRYDEGVFTSGGP